MIMINIYNYTYGQYIELSEDDRNDFNLCIQLARNLVKKDYVSTEEVTDWCFEDVKELMQRIDNTEEFLTYLMSKRKEYQLCKIAKTEAYKILFSFQSVFESIVDLIITEQKTLSVPSDPEQEEASQSVDFSMFGYYPQLLELAQDDVLRIEKVAKIPYCEAYTYLFYSAKKTKYEKKIQEIYKRKHK